MRKLCPHLLLASALTLSLSACSPAQPDALLADYQARLARVLDLSAQTPDTATMPALPEIREVRKMLTSHNLDLSDLVALRHCDLQHLVAERNSSLGKVMDSANTLAYEIQLLQQLRPCLQHPALTAELKTELQHIYLQKQQQLPWVLHNFLNTDPTLRQQLQGSQRGLRPGAAVTPTLQALQQLVAFKLQLQNTAPAALDTLDAQSIQQPVAALYQSQLLADWQYSTQRSLQWLRVINQQLSNVAALSLCPAPRYQAQRDILQTIVSQIFAGRVQVYLAELDQIGYQLLPLLEQLYADTAMATIVQQRFSQPATQLRQELKRHVGVWQQLLQPCEPTPNSSSTP